MSISRRSLVMVVVLILAVAMWTLWPNSGPGTASADALAPFQTEVVGREAAGHEFVRGSDPADESGVGSSDVTGAAVADLLAGRLTGKSEGPQLVEISGDRAVFGSTVLRLVEKPTWAADVDGDGELNESDIASFQELWDWADPGADFNADGVVDPYDYADFVAAYDQREKVPGAGLVRVTESDARLRVQFVEAVRANTVSLELSLDVLVEPKTGQ